MVLKIFLHFFVCRFDPLVFIAQIKQKYFLSVFFPVDILKYIIYHHQLIFSFMLSVCQCSFISQYYNITEITDLGFPVKLTPCSEMKYSFEEVPHNRLLATFFKKLING